MKDNNEFEVIDDEALINEKTSKKNEEKKVNLEEYDFIDEEALISEKAPKKNENKKVDLDEFDVIDDENDEVVEEEKEDWTQKYLNANLWDQLQKLSNGYIEQHNSGSIPTKNVLEYRNLALTTLDARIEAIEADGEMESVEYGECTFLRNALRNGWLTSDINMLTQLYETIHDMKEGTDKGKGLDLLESIEKIKCDSVEKRYEMMEATMSFLLEQNAADVNSLHSVVSDSFEKEIYPTEFYNDNNFTEGRKYGESVTLKSLRVNLDFKKELKKKEKKSTREKTEYVMEVKSEEDLEKFKPHKGHIHNNITKSNRKALKEVFGEEIYDDIDEMHKGSSKERTVKLYHAYGNKLMKEGIDVLELDYAGSGFQDVAHAHKGRTGKVYQDTEARMAEQYGGRQVKKSDGTPFKYIRAQDTEVVTKTGDTLIKTRYSIAGPTPDLWLFPGTFNVGEYSIENTKKYGREFAKKFLLPHFKAWKNKQEVPHDLHIRLTGHSRGAVAAGQAIKLINKWIDDAAKTNPEFKEYKKYVHYDAFFREPVPGVITDLHLSSCNLRDIPNVNVTVFCSMAQEHGDFLYPLQYVKGARRLIIGTTEHTDMKDYDKSQDKLVGDRAYHQMGFYDAETGEMYRGSGVDQMPDGVYISDEKQNLIRISSYSQLGKVIDAVYDGQNKQSTRVKNIHKMVRDWFLEHKLEMSFVDDETRTEERYKYDNNVDRILSNRNKRLRPIKLALTYLRELEKNNAPIKRIKEAQNNVIEACRYYMKKTVIPTEGDSAYRMNLVSDTLSFVMRENNYLTKLEKGNVIEDENSLDKRIRDHKERLDKKDGALERKLAKESKRIQNEEEINEMIVSMANWCKDALAVLDLTRIGKITSDEYDAFHETLVAGKNMGAKTSIVEFTDFLKKLTNVSDEYTLYHDSFFGPLTGDGQKRLDYSKKASKLAKSTGEKLAKKAMYVPDKEIPIGQKLENHRKAANMLIKHATDKKKADIKQKEDIQKKAKENLKEKPKVPAL